MYKRKSALKRSAERLGSVPARLKRAAKSRPSADLQPAVSGEPEGLHDFRTDFSDAPSRTPRRYEKRVIRSAARPSGPPWSRGARVDSRRLRPPPPAPLRPPPAS